MNRLTKRIDGSLVFPNELIGVMMTPSNDTMCRILTRLAAYEDTGLTPEEIEEFAEDVAYQFGYYFPIKDMLYISTGGLSTLERAFDILGWNEPHHVPECECEVPGCHEHATCGTPTQDG